jgi:hypothetical protein
LPRFDLHSPFLSLPFALRASGDDLSMGSEYLRADVLDVARWRAQTDSSVKSLNVGLVWRGNPSNKNDRVRIVSLAAMLAYLPAGLRYFSLQKNPDEVERVQLSDAGVGDSCIWYPTIRLFRQGDERNWRSVLGRIRFELTRLAPSA